MFNRAAKQLQSPTMRDKSQWTPGGIVLWLIAAILATLIVCTERDPEPEPPPGAPVEVELEVEIID
jgi:hypothetical protein